MWSLQKKKKKNSQDDNLIPKKLSTNWWFKSISLALSYDYMASLGGTVNVKGQKVNVSHAMGTFGIY